MKIALVSPYDFSYPGGVVRHIASLERHFTRMGHVVKIIAPASSPVEGYGDRFIQIGKPRPVPTSGSIARITISLTLTNKVKEVLEKEKFDIIHLHEPLAPTLCTTVLRLSNTINIGTFHATESKPSYRWTKPLFLSGLYKKWFNKLHGRIAVSKPAMDFINRFFPSTYDIIPNGIDLEHFSPNVKPMEQFMDGKINLLFVSRLEKRKGLEYLLKAYRLIKPDYPNIRLIIVGPGTRLRKKYEKMVADAELEDVIFTGAVDYQDLPRYYKSADIFCAPATGHESFGIILLEAMATGKPVVASSISGYSTVVSHGVDGLLVPPKQEVPLAQAISTLIRSEELRKKMGEQGIKKSANFGWEYISRRVMNYYLSILMNHSRVIQ
ncbi:MAG: glycosyltransferase family 4 protein [Dehalococcoidales bacterium]|jgi:phosphatidylinositol alpha-mannosyltransferase|nr:glycosyltransferase family 4 protein [Dehalococcoidales bacterium]